MINWFNDMGLRNKLNFIIGAVILCIIIGIVIGQITFSRTIVGGEIYNSITLKMQTAHIISKLFLNINIARSRVSAMMIERDREKLSGHVDVIREQTLQIDEMFEKVEKNLSLGDEGEALAFVKRARQKWIDLRRTRDDEVIPLIFEGAHAQAERIAADVQVDRFRQMIDDTGQADSLLKVSIERAEKNMKSEAFVLRWAYIFGGLLFAALLFAGSRFFSSTIIKPIVLVSARSREMAEGIFSSSSQSSQGNNIPRKDEIGSMLKDFSTMSNKLCGIVSSIRDGMINLTSASDVLSASAADMSRTARDQAQQAEQVETATRQMSETIIDIAHNAGRTSTIARNSSDVALSGKDTVSVAVAAMLKIAEDVKASSEMIERLGRSTTQIGEIASVINDIAELTNLLALNAAIEAARAGDQGRGFAIVADEVRKLAERTTKATADISKRISAIQTEAKTSVELMKKSSLEVDRGVAVAEAASRSMDSVVEAASSAVDMVHRIAAATEQQSATTEEITRNMGSISGLISHSAEASDQINTAAATLAGLAVEIQGNIGWFKTGGPEILSRK
jgi:methyl-accepting chemotaxis protein